MTSAFPKTVATIAREREPVVDLAYGFRAAFRLDENRREVQAGAQRYGREVMHLGERESAASTPAHSSRR